MSRIGLHDTTEDVLTKMSDGNPGALTAMLVLLKHPEIDPANIMGHLGVILMLDTYGIYGSDIYVLWSDICDRDTVKMVAVVRATQMGLFDCNTLIDACHRQDHSGKKMIPVEELYAKVCKELPNFDKAGRRQEQSEQKK